MELGGVETVVGMYCKKKKDLFFNIKMKNTGMLEQIRKFAVSL